MFLRGDTTCQCTAALPGCSLAYTQILPLTHQPIALPRCNHANFLLSLCPSPPDAILLVRSFPPGAPAMAEPEEVTQLRQPAAGIVHRSARSCLWKVPESPQEFWRCRSTGLLLQGHRERLQKAFSIAQRC